jgi:hypothetical protein
MRMNKEQRPATARNAGRLIVFTMPNQVEELNTIW